jgi:glycerol-3-phosphate dehydrogenase
MRSLAELANARFDVAIIGGGIIGAGVARDLALRGVSVALFEQKDFGSGTTSGSTRLIHGGLRYLEMLDFKLVRLDLREREILLRIAPHLVKPLEFRIPFVNHSWLFRERMRAGLTLYDWLSFDKSLPNHRFLSRDQAHRDEPALIRRGLQGAGSYFDAQVRSPERLCLENIMDAAAHGAVVRNYCTVLKARAGEVTVRFEESGDTATVRAAVVVNATGAWFDRVRRSAFDESSARIRTTKGIHLVCGPMARKANVLFSPVDGRLFFVLPLAGKTWIGTTDTDFEDDPGSVNAEPRDVGYLLRSVEPFFPSIGTLPLHATNAGVRALVRSSGSASSVSRMHRIEETSPGVVSILGGKITGYRAIAEETSGVVCRLLKKNTVCRTAEEPLPGGKSYVPLGDDLYGSRASVVSALAEKHGSLAAEVLIAMREEFCVHLEDFLLRRTMHAFDEDQGASLAEAAAEIMAAEAQWTRERTQSELTRYMTTVGRITQVDTVKR